MENLKLQGKVAFVTGASSGIGEATAVGLAAEGARVALAARRGDRLMALAERIRSMGGKATPLEVDITDESAVATAVQEVLAAWERIDLLLNVAGVGVAAPFRNTTPDEYRQMVDVNVLGVLYPIRAVLPAMTAQGEGHIVVVSSGTGRYIHASTVYSGTKHAVSAMAESLRRELAPDGIRVTSASGGRPRLLDRVGELPARSGNDLSRCRGGLLRRSGLGLRPRPRARRRPEPRRGHG
jgi:NADP-dependent 3-hydroxy acid dehydrogenase YdfG